MTPTNKPTSKMTRAEMIAEAREIARRCRAVANTAKMMGAVGAPFAAAGAARTN